MVMEKPVHVTPARPIPPPPKVSVNPSLAECVAVPLSSPGNDSVSGSSDRQQKDLRARYWTFMFDNLRRAADAIYETCWTDKSSVECREAILILENHTRDFAALIEYLDIEQKWTDSGGDMKKSVKWEIRKTAISSPTKMGILRPPTSLSDLQSSTGSLSCNASTQTEGTDVQEDGVQCDLLRASSTTTASTSELLNTDIDVQTETTATSEPEPHRPQTTSYAEKVKRKSVDSTVSTNSSGSQGGRSTRLPVPPESRRDARLKDEFLQSRLYAASEESCRRRPLIPTPKAPGQGIRETRASIAKREFNLRYIEEMKSRRSANNDVWGTGGQMRDRFRYTRSGLLGSNTQSVSALNDASNGGKEPKPGTWRLVKRRNRFRSYQSSESLLSLHSIKEDIDTDKMCENTTEASETPSLPSPQPKLEEADNEVEGVEDESSRTEPVRKLLKPPPHKKKSPKKQLKHALVHNVLSSDSCNVPDDEQSLQYLTEEEMSLAEEEESIKKAIDIEQRSVVEMDAEAGGNDDDAAASPDAEPEPVPSSWDELVARWKAESAVPCSWSQMVELEGVRPPGKAVKTHERLSSPSRKPDIQGLEQKHQERQENALRRRAALMDEQAARLGELMVRQETVRDRRQAIQQEKRLLLERRMAKAEENRQEHLLAIVRKAHDAESRSHEISFIAALEASNKRHEVLEKYRGDENRLQQLQDQRRKDRQRRLEEKAAQLAAAEERRKVIEQERTARTQEADKVAGRRKAADRAATQSVTELQRRVANASTTTPSLEDQKDQTTPPALQTSASVNEEDEKIIATLRDFVTAQNKSKNTKKRRVNLRKKLQTYSSQCVEVEALRVKPSASDKLSQKAQMAVSVISKIDTTTIAETSCQRYLDRCLGLAESLATEEAFARAFYTNTGGTSILQLLVTPVRKDKHIEVPIRQLVRIAALVRSLVNTAHDLALALLIDNHLPFHIECLCHCLSIIDAGSNSSECLTPVTQLCVELLFLLIDILAILVASYSLCSVNCDKTPCKPCCTLWPKAGLSSFSSHLLALAQFSCSLQTLDHVSLLLRSAAHAHKLHSDRPISPLIPHALSFVTNLLQISCLDTQGVAFAGAQGEQSAIVAELKRSHLLPNLLDLAYTLLVATPADSLMPAELVAVLKAVFALIIVVARLDALQLQTVLAEEGTSLEFRHIASFLLSYCLKQELTDLLHDVIICIGYFAVTNAMNQTLVQSGTQPTILHQLCSLPFCYFSNAALCRVLLPTLCCVTHEHTSNTEAMKREVSPIIIAKFIEEVLDDAQSETGSQKSASVDKFSFNLRFPRNRWQAALDYFNNFGRNMTSASENE